MHAPCRGLPVVADSAETHPQREHPWPKGDEEFPHGAEAGRVEVGEACAVREAHEAQPAEDERGMARWERLAPLHDNAG